MGLTTETLPPVEAYKKKLRRDRRPSRRETMSDIVSELASLLDLVIDHPSFANGVTLCEATRAGTFFYKDYYLGGFGDRSEVGEELAGVLQRSKAFMEMCRQSAKSDSDKSLLLEFVRHIDQRHRWVEIASDSTLTPDQRKKEFSQFRKDVLSPITREENAESKSLEREESGLNEVELKCKELKARISARLGRGK